MDKRTHFDQLFRIYFEKLYRFVHQYISDEEECRDIVSAAFEDVWRNYDAVKTDTAAAYLYRTAYNHLIDFLRRQNLQHQYIDYAVYTAQRYINEDRMAEQEANDRVTSYVLRHLGEPTATILKACFVDGKSYKKVAAELDMSLANVKKHMVKALKTIREMKKNIKR